MKKIALLISFIISVLFFAQAGVADSDFDPQITGNYGFNSSGYPVNKILIQSDGKAIVCGNFTTFRGVSRNRIARLNVDGSLDTAFNPGAGANLVINALALQTDGKIVIGGNFTSYDGVSIIKLARLNTDGSLDSTFNPGNAIINNVNGVNEQVNAIAIQEDGKILVGKFTNPYEPTAKQNVIVRFNSDGSIDNSFDSGLGFSNSNLEPVFIYSINILSNGQALVAGKFASYNGSSVKNIVRLDSNGILDTTFTSNSVDGYIFSTVIQPDGKIIVVGSSKISRLNSDGTVDTTFNAGTGADNYIMSISRQTDGKFIIGGWFKNFNGYTRNYLARLNSNGSLDTSFDVANGPNTWVYTVPIQQDGKILIGGTFTSFNGTARNYIARVNSDGSLDTNYNLGETDNIQTITAESDGKTIIGGNFTAPLNQSSSNRIARLTSDGQFDPDFNAGGAGADNIILTSKTQEDGKILIGGQFTSYNNININRLARLNNDGTLDNSFNIGTGANGTVNAIGLTADQKILVAGEFTTFNGTNRNKIIRLNSVGSIDNSFNTGSGPNDIINALAIQQDQKVIIAGWFTMYNGTTANRIARLNNDGTLDTSFNIGSGFNSTLRCLAIQSDGKIIVGGGFSSYNGKSVNNIVRLNTDGTLDDSFTGTGSNSTVRSITIQPDGRIVISGIFTSYNGVAVNKIARLNRDGSLDTTFNTGGSGANDIIYTSAILPNGKVVFGGGFSSYNGVAHNRIARVGSYAVQPEAESVQNFCGSNTLGDLNVSGQNLKWYQSEYGGASIPTSTLLVHNQTYYVSQTIDSVESARIAIKTPNEKPSVPTGETVQSFEAGDDLNVLVVSGTKIKWYASVGDATNHTNVLPVTTKIINNTIYYATQTIGICESSLSLAVRAYNEILSSNEVEDSQLKIFPNPVKDVINFAGQENISKVVVISIDGKKIIEQMMNGVRYLNVRYLIQGTYLIHVFTEKGVQSFKFIKN